MALRPPQKNSKKTGADVYDKADQLASKLADKAYTGTSAENPDDEIKVRRSLSLPKYLDDAVTEIARHNAFYKTGPESVSAVVAEFIRQGVEAAKAK
ncbi:hypothetical protein ACVOZ6_004707 [Escherichia coli]